MGEEEKDKKLDILEKRKELQFKKKYYVQLLLYVVIIMTLNIIAGALSLFYSYVTTSLGLLMIVPLIAIIMRLHFTDSGLANELENMEDL